ncbi:hydroxysteroid dehydrogenase-like protein 1 [Trichogramma pretiosum]|uniref:hydroxysteroid dehydrogenase-like protein 1 n=1 Tax=Trichogramma pretiosum TaxID=7493 RepID=UPI0006C9C811|nr:hydroxysteroid dehydrogenase-like protein 1 [Trichogramma pretiosum]XP_014234179.1 hydroxysteroid dehydrogenase-like protein 1 [Trichogramma pretiosum]
MSARLVDIFFILMGLALGPILKFLYGLYGFFINLLSYKPIDLKARFGDWAVVTGCTDGIGKEYVKLLAKQKMNIVLISRNIDKLNATKAELEKIYPDIETIIIKTDFSTGRKVIDDIKVHLKDVPVAILVNNVGVITEYPMYFGEMSESDLWDTININIGATTSLTHLLINQMKKRGNGAIVNVSSASEMMPLPLMSIYSASKIFIRYFSDSLREEYSPHGITVQCLSPFYINTKMINFSKKFSKAYYFVPDPETYARHALKTLGRLNSTTGFWLHDILKFLSLMIPTRMLRSKVGFLINKIYRNDYFNLHEKQTQAWKS